MEGRAGFRVLLGRLADHRQLEVGEVCRSAGVGEAVLSAVDAGAAPEPEILRSLAPVLGLHAADLFAIAGVDVPADLRPVDASLDWRCFPDLVLRPALVLSPQNQEAVYRYAATLRQQKHTRSTSGPTEQLRDTSGAGGLLVRLLWNRCPGWTTIARTFYHVTGRYWSAATYRAVGRETKPLTPDLVHDFAALLDIPAADLAVLTGTQAPTSPPSAQAGTVVADLIWELRRLTFEQIQHVGQYAEALHNQPHQR